jgi:peptide subunit release factor 1 (eRF1)
MSTTLIAPEVPALAGIASALKTLVQIPPHRHHIVSCFLRLESGDRERRHYYHELKSRVDLLRSGLDRLGLDRNAHQGVGRDLGRILAAVENASDLPHARGIALFACEELQLYLAVPLPRVHRTRLVLDDTPWVRELVAAEPECGRVFVAVLDRRRARFFAVVPGSTSELDALVPATGPTAKYHRDEQDAPGVGERSFHGRLEEERRRHYAAVVDRLDRLAQAGDVRGVVIAGPLAHTAAVTRMLPPRLARQLLGRIRLPVTPVTPAEVGVATLAAAEQHQAKLVDRELHLLRESLGTGLATSGPRETLAALARGQIRTLYVGLSQAPNGFRCADGGLVLTRGDCRGKAEPRPVSDIVDEAVEAALSQGATVVTIEDPQLAASVQGIAALLRFR